MNIYFRGFAPAINSNEGSQLEVNKQDLSFLYVCMVNTIYLLSFVETPRKFIIAIKQDLLRHETAVCELRRVK